MSILDTKEGTILQNLSSGNSLDADHIYQKIQEDLHPGQLSFVTDTTTQISALSSG